MDSFKISFSKKGIIWLGLKNDWILKTFIFIQSEESQFWRTSTLTSLRNQSWFEKKHNLKGIDIFNIMHNRSYFRKYCSAKGGNTQSCCAGEHTFRIAIKKDVPRAFIAELPWQAMSSPISPLEGNYSILQTVRRRRKDWFWNMDIAFVQPIVMSKWKHWCRCS